MTLNPNISISRKDFGVSIRTLAESVYDFHVRFGVTDVETDDDLRKRLAILVEEVGEHARALNRQNSEQAIKEAVDIAYVALGTLLCYAQAGADACYEVAAKNDAKQPQDGFTETATGKVVGT